MLDSENHLSVFANERSGKFSAWRKSPPQGSWISIRASDATHDGQIDIVGVNTEGQLVSLSDVDKQSSWKETVLTTSVAVSEMSSSADSRLLDADFDNNGATDWLFSSGASTVQLWLSQPDYRLVLCRAKLPGQAYGIADMDSDGRMDVLARTTSGELCYYKNAGQKSYHGFELCPQASRGKTDGDNRINSFGIGGTIEVRAGTFVSTQTIRQPVVHLGLGNNVQADVVRVLWPNGTFQYEFNATANETVVATQRLKGSCPFLFAWDGAQYEFVTDFMWSTPLGMFINASDKGGFLQTTDWVKLPAERLAARDGQYELRVNANLWETHYFDHLALRAIDHPADAQLVVDEKFYLEPAAPQLHWVSTPETIERVKDQLGHDLAQVLAKVDATYVELGERGRYQGLMPEHWIEFEVPSAKGHPQWLLARGWIHPTDSSINFAIAQGKHPVPHGLILEVRTPDDQWQVVNDRLGFPAGKNKTIIVPLVVAADANQADNQVMRTYRLRTNLEIYWDWIGLTSPLVEIDFAEHELPVIQAELRSRGIVDMTQASANSPELPVYERLIARGQYWRDLVGYHTRPGDIHELLAKVDDRYAILTAGDEVIMKFKEGPSTPVGWVRDFVWVSDGWVKDGDLNTRYGKTVLPLPTHSMPAYAGDPNVLQNDPVVQRFPKDWETFHTRYIDTHQFDRGLRRFQQFRSEEASQ